MKSRKSLYDKIKERWKKDCSDKTDEKLREVFQKEFEAGLDFLRQEITEKWGGFRPIPYMPYSEKRFDIVFVRDTKQVIAVFPNPSQVIHHNWIFKNKYDVLVNVNMSEMFQSGCWANDEMLIKINLLNGE